MSADMPPPPIEHGLDLEDITHTGNTNYPDNTFIHPGLISSIQPYEDPVKHPYIPDVESGNNPDLVSKGEILESLLYEHKILMDSIVNNEIYDASNKVEIRYNSGLTITKEYFKDSAMVDKNLTKVKIGFNIGLRKDIKAGKYSELNANNALDIDNAHLIKNVTIDYENSVFKNGYTKTIRSSTNDEKKFGKSKVIKVYHSREKGDISLKATMYREKSKLNTFTIQIPNSQDKIYFILNEKKGIMGVGKREEADFYTSIKNMNFDNELNFFRESLNESAPYTVFQTRKGTKLLFKNTGDPNEILINSYNGDQIKVSINERTGSFSVRALK